MKKSFLLLGATAVFALTGCGKKIKINPDKHKYLVGIAQFAMHSMREQLGIVDLYYYKTIFVLVINLLFLWH